MKKLQRYLLALVLALINDLSDYFVFLQPFETILDVLLAIGIILLLKDRLGFRHVVILLLDILPFFDFIPIWSIYIIYIIITDKEFLSELIDMVIK